MSKALIVSYGLHGPWNKGEGVLSRNFTRLLANLYDELTILSAIDAKRGKPDLSGLKDLDIKYISKPKELRRFIKAHDTPSTDVHFLNMSLMSYPKVLLRDRVFTYQFAYRVLNIPSVTARAVSALILSQVSCLRAITTSPIAYRNLCKFLRRNFYYVPAPIEIQKVRSMHCMKSGFLKCIYLGYGHYFRFPYIKIFRALRRLNRDGYNIRLDICIPEQSYVDYLTFVKGLRLAIIKMNLKGLVRIKVSNLEEDEKYDKLANNDVLLYPALMAAAIDPPLVVLEAMSLGRCVVASSVQSIPYILGEGRGVVINQHDLENEVYNTLKTLANEPDLVRDYGVNARRWIIKTHNPVVVQKKIKDVMKA
ncbi:MAG: glycosyltransferase [Nitrososphaeria archaeon]